MIYHPRREAPRAINRIPTDTEFNNRLTQRGRGRLLCMQCAGSPNPTKMEDPLLQELLQIADSEASGAASCNSCRRNCHNGRV